MYTRILTFKFSTIGQSLNAYLMHRVDGAKSCWTGLSSHRMRESATAGYDQSRARASAGLKQVGVFRAAARAMQSEFCDDKTVLGFN